jgi:FkbM family methyltransferase
MTAWDLGANAGVYTLLLSRLVGPSGSVCAFEPLPESCADLLNHLSLNGCENVTVVAAAVAEQDGLRGFQPGASRSMGALKNDLAGLIVPTLSLDGLLVRHQLAIPDLVKVDVEGAEAQVLKGATRVLSGHRTRWVVSVHSREQAHECRRIFQEAGYLLFDIAGRRISGSSADDGVTEIVAVPPTVASTEDAAYGAP